MSINQAHHQGGLLLYQGEQIVNHSKNVTLSFDDINGQCGEIFRGKHKGKVFVTTHRMIFLGDDQRDNLLSFAVAFMYMKNLHIEQPLFGANYISGVVAAHPNGGFQGEVKFQLTYSSGGAIDASIALRQVNSVFHQQIEGAPPSYGMAAANLYEPPPPSYQAAQATNNHFAETTMYVSPAQAPYEGVYQRQPAGLPKAEFIPQYPPQPAYQNNGSNGQIYVPQMNEQQMPSRSITSKDVALLPQPGLNLAESIRFSPDDTLLTYLRSPNQTLTRQLYAYNLQTDKEFVYAEPDIDDEQTEDNLSMEEKLRRERQRQLITGITRYQWSKSKTQPSMLIPVGSDLYIHNGKELRLLLNGSNQPPIIDPKFSPDGSLVAYVQDCELYCVSTVETSAQPRQLTFDARGHPNKTNGLAEFVAQEEMERSEGFWWSPNSRCIAFTQVDESNIPIFRITHSGSSDPDQIEEHRYPFAGKTNAQVTIGLIDLTDDNKTIPDIHWIDLSPFTDYYIARINFFPDNSLALQIENREQTKLQLYQYDYLNKKPLKLIIEETSQSWINLHDLFHTLKKTPSQFIWASERTGFMHLELYDLNTGQLIKPLTNGDWVVQRLVDIDEENAIIYFLANRETPLEVHLYSVNYKDDIQKIDRITQEAGCHAVHCFNSTYEYCLTQWNSIDQYPIIRILDVKKKEIIKNLDHLQQGPLETIEQFHLVKPQLLKIQNRNNETLYCAVYQPDDEQGRHQTPYPTVVSVYGGPHLQRVINSWSLRVDMRTQRLVESGYVVLRLDNRGSPNRGLAFESAIRYDMGHLELDDQIDGIRYLIKQGITDKTRVGMYGWSYGGYLSAMALVRASDVFKLGIAGAPVTHWDGYDTHYTERYMGTPEGNPHGYAVSSVMHYVNNLTGHLMIMHGLIDENVHFRHTARLINALIRANKPYELILFPDERHMPRKIDDRIYMEDRIFEFIRKNL